MTKFDQTSGMYRQDWNSLQLERPEPTETAIDARIRRMARADGLTARKARRGGHLWYFINASNTLQSPECGLAQQEAWEYLTASQGGD